MNAARRALFGVAAATLGCSLVMNPGRIRDEAALADGSAPTDGSVPESDAANTVDGVANTAIFRDDFEALSNRQDWADGTTEGEWSCDYAGGGTAGIEVDGTKSFFLSPLPRDGGSESALVTTRRNDFGDVDFTIRVKTVAQLRAAPQPNEAATVTWRQAPGTESSYYVIVGLAQWELGTRSAVGVATPLKVGGPGCAVGKWCKLHVRDVGGNVAVSLDDGATGTATLPAMGAGRIGLYVDDAHVRFDDLVVFAP